MAASSGQQLESENVEARWNITSSASQKVSYSVTSFFFHTVYTVSTPEEHGDAGHLYK